MSKAVRISIERWVQMKLRKSRNLLSLICFGRWSRKPHPIERLEKGLGRENCSLMMYTMNTQVAIVLGCITAAIILMVHMTQALELITGVDAAYPSQDSSFCQVGSDGTAKRLRQIIDITHAYREDLPCWLSEDGLGSRTRLVHSIAEGEVANLSELRFDVVHSGTHVDAPGHFVQEYYEQGPDVASLDLNVLLGKQITYFCLRCLRVRISNTKALRENELAHDWKFRMGEHKKNGEELKIMERGIGGQYMRRDNDRL